MRLIRNVANKFTEYRVAHSCTEIFYYSLSIRGSRLRSEKYGMVLNGSKQNQRASSIIDAGIGGVESYQQPRILRFISAGPNREHF